MKDLIYIKNNEKIYFFIDGNILNFGLICFYQ